jgi:hypothetical protein
MTVEELKDLIQDKKGSITKVDVFSPSNVTIGTHEYGYFKLLENTIGGAHVACYSNDSWLRTSQIKESIKDGDNIMLTTQTSVYKIVLEEKSE